MILEFKVENYLSFKEQTTLSMIASSSISKKELDGAIAVNGKSNILKSAAIFGANASGKSNFIKAIGFMRAYISRFTKPDPKYFPLVANTFKLSTDTIDKPSIFEMTFMVKNDGKFSSNENIIFRYGFQLTQNRVESEWLFAKFTSNESKLFTRDKDKISVGEKFKEGKQILSTLSEINEKRLFLSLIYMLKGSSAPLSAMVMDWFLNLNDITTISIKYDWWDIENLMRNTDIKKKIEKALSIADVGIEKIMIEYNSEKIEYPDEEEFYEDDLVSLKTFHNQYNSKKEIAKKIEFDFSEESDGTKKFFLIIGPIIMALEKGFVLVVDEIDSRLHPNLFLSLISLFNSKETNRHNAQLIFATHNPLIMDKDFLRRDQIYFVKKDKYGESTLSSLVDYRVRNDASFGKNYLMGKYGATPYLGNFDSMFDKE